jgi:hypothetical protein
MKSNLEQSTYSCHMRLFVAFLLLFPILLHAQESSPKRTCRILFLNPPAEAPRKLFLFDGVSSREVELPESNFSDVYQVAGGETVLRLMTKAVTKVEEIPAGAPAAKVSAAIVDFYLVATADPANANLPIQLQVIDATADKFKKGQMLWYNLVPNAMGGTLGSQKLAMKPMSRQIIDAPAKDGESYPVSLSYLIPGDPKFHSICETQWMHDSRSRMVMFVFAGGKNRAPQVAGFKDFRAPAEKSP